MNSFIKKTLSAFCCLTLATIATAQPEYSKTDSINIEKWLNESRQIEGTPQLVMFFTEKLKDIPYVAYTLDQNSEERLVVNTRELDCTTYVENVMALALCASNKMYHFPQFCFALQKIRYVKGQIHYTTRKHYFTTWINDNTSLGLIETVDQPNPPFSATQIVDVDYMSTHPDAYAMLKKHPEWMEDITGMEKEISGMKERYIPSAVVDNSSLLRQFVFDGDIIAIVTKKKGLDISHVGFAKWHKDGLHLMNASMIRKKVVDDPYFDFLFNFFVSIGLFDYFCNCKVYIANLKQKYRSWIEYHMRASLNQRMLTC